MDPVTLNALTRRWQLDELGLDQEANLARINTRSALSDLKRSKKRDVEKSAALLADRGLARSGIATKAGLDLQDTYNRSAGKIQREKATTLSTIARKRLQAKADYDQARAAAALGLSATGSTTSGQ